MAWCGKGGAAQLLTVKAIIAFLGAVHALWQCAWQSFGLKVIAKSGHIPLVGPGEGRGLDHFVGIDFAIHGALLFMFSVSVIVDFVTNKA
jgi:hypothetical protein